MWDDHVERRKFEQLWRVGRAGSRFMYITFVAIFLILLTIAVCFG
jgi:hypothetical protein